MVARTLLNVMLYYIVLCFVLYEWDFESVTLMDELR